MIKMKLYIYLRSHDIQHKMTVRMTFEELEQWIQDNQDIFEAYQTECDITDHYDRLVASNCFSTTKLQPWTVSH